MAVTKTTKGPTITVVDPKTGGKSKQIDLGQWAYDEVQCVPPPLDPQVLAGLYSRSVAHKACVDAKTANTVGLGWVLKPKIGNTDADVREVAEQVIAWLEDCSKRDEKTFDDILMAMRKDEEAVGWGAVEITRDGKGAIDGLFHIHAYTLRRRRDKSGWVQKVQGTYVFFRKYGLSLEDAVKLDERYAATNEILVIGEMSPDSPFYPMPDSVPALGDIAGDEAAQKYQTQFFTNNAVPRLAILVNGGKLDESAKEYLLAYLREGLQGEQHKTLLLETEAGDGITIQIEKLTVGQTEDASFMEYRKFNRDQVIMAHRVSPTKVTIVENANLANSKDQDKTFKEQVLRPDQGRYTKRIQWILEDEFGKDLPVTFTFNEMDLADELQIAQTRSYYVNSMTNNEVRRLYGLPDAGLDPLTGKVADQELVDWGKQPFEISQMPGQEAGGLGANGKKISAEHKQFVNMARELGFHIESIREGGGDGQAGTKGGTGEESLAAAPQPTAKSMPAPRIVLEKGAIQLATPPTNGHKPRKQITKKDFVLGPGNVVTGVVETTTEED